MRKIKKAVISIVSMVLVISMVGTSSGFAGSLNTQNEKLVAFQSLNHRESAKESGESSESSGCFLYDGHGEFELVSKGKPSFGCHFSDIKSVKQGEFVEAKEVYENMLYQVGERYLVSADNNTYTLSDRLFIDHLAPEDSFIQYKEYDIPKEVKNQIIEESLAQHDLDEKEQYDFFIYAPSQYMPELSETQLLRSVVVPPTGTSTYTYNGYSMKDYTVERTIDSHVTVVGETSSSYAVGLAIVSLLLIPLTGGTSTYSNLFSGAVTAVSAFITLFGAINGGGTTSDKLEVWLHYRFFTKYTYVYYLDEWLIGLQSTCAITKNIWEHQYYANNGHHFTDTIPFEERYDSPRFGNPSSQALLNVINNAIILDNPIRIKFTYEGANNINVTKTIKVQ